MLLELHRMTAFAFVLRTNEYCSRFDPALRFCKPSNPRLEEIQADQSLKTLLGRLVSLYLSIAPRETAVRDAR